MIKNLVSIVIPTYNDAQYLEDCLDDLLKQTYTNFEVIIVNDGSTDNTIEIVNKYCEKDIRFKLYNKQNGGTGSALNLGFKNISGEFATWISSDDRKTEDYIFELTNFLINNRDIEFVTAAFYSDYCGKILRAFIPTENEIKGYRRGFFGNEEQEVSGKSFCVDEWVDINYEQCYQGVNFMFTSRLKEKCGDYLEIPGEDYYMTAKMGINTRVGYIDKVLGTHKNPIDSLSNINRACVIQANILTRKLIEENYRPWLLKQIPKIAHFYWGSEKMSYLRYMTIKSFYQNNPDWSIILYLPKNIINNKITWTDINHRCDTEDYVSNQNYFGKLRELPIKIIHVSFPENVGILGEAQKSDYLRWRVLYKDGGFWSDMDILFRKPLSYIYFNKTQFINLDNTVSINKYHGHQIGFFFSKPKNGFFGLLIEKTKLCLENKIERYQQLGCEILNSLEHYDTQKYNLNIHNVDSNTFYKFDHNMLEKVYLSDNNVELNNSVIGIHWYGGHPLSQEYNNLLNEFTVEKYKNTLTSIIKELK